MSVIIADNEEDLIRILKKNKKRVFKITKEVIYALPSSYTTQFPSEDDFLKYVDEHPKKVFTAYYYVTETIKEVEEV